MKTSRTPAKRPRQLAAITVAAGLVSCEPMADELQGNEVPADIFRSRNLVEPAQNPTELRILSWNVKYAGARLDFWFDYWGDRTAMTKAEVTANLENLCELVREVDPVVFLAQVIEINARRKRYVNMISHMLECTQLNYAAYAPAWKSRYVPSEGFGRVNLGNAIFSKYPITQASRIRQADRTDLDALTQKFYLHRTIGRAQLQLAANRSLVAYVVHTEAYDQDGTKDQHLAQIKQIVANEPSTFLVGGDFNELPPNAIKRVNFPDEHPDARGTSFEQPPYRPELMRWFYDDLQPWITLEQFGETIESQAHYYSHSVIGPATIGTDGRPGSWNRTLDHLFSSRDTKWIESDSDVLQTAGRQGIAIDPLFLSDHAPIVGTLRLSGENRQQRAQ